MHLRRQTVASVKVKGPLNLPYQNYDTLRLFGTLQHILRSPKEPRSGLYGASPSRSISRRTSDQQVLTHQSTLRIHKSDLTKQRTLPLGSTVYNTPQATTRLQYLPCCGESHSTRNHTQRRRRSYVQNHPREQHGYLALAAAATASWKLRH